MSKHGRLNLHSLSGLIADASIETKTIGIVIDAHALVDVSYYLVISVDGIATQINTRSILNTHYI